jgi:hypothetical protein
MDGDQPIGYQREQRGVGGCTMLLQLDAVLQDRKSVHRWQVTSPPQHGRVCSDPVGSHIASITMDTDHAMEANWRIRVSRGCTMLL